MSELGDSLKSRPQPSWLRDAVIYEIYPQSFRDSNGDGIGDLRGIIEKLDYVKSLGCTALWLNPCFQSPFRDAGYDISDYRKVAPRYGTNEDLILLFTEAHARGLRVILDLVAGHTSDQHPWFKASAGHEPNAFSDHYIWTPSVWQSAMPDFAMVRGVAERNGGYLPNFFPFQPALNFGFAAPDPASPWQQPASAPGPQAVRREMRDIMQFWLELGCDGFRVDMADSLIKGRGEEKLTAMKGYWQEVRAWFDRDWPEAILISEWSRPHEAIDAGFHVDFLVHMGQHAYNSLFRAESRFGCEVPGGRSFFSAEGRGDITLFTGYYDRTFAESRAVGYMSLPTGNHDIFPRLADHRTDAELKVALAFLFTMPGIPVIYQGDEIGMRYVPGLPSKEGGFERTGSRTPMQWNASAGAGFSDAPEKDFYLPLDPVHPRPDVLSQQGREDSLLEFVRRLIDLRRNFPALGSDGGYRSLYARAGENLFVFERSLGKQRMVVAVNPSNQRLEVTVGMPDFSMGTVICASHETRPEKVGDGLRLEVPAPGFLIFELDSVS